MSKTNDGSFTRGVSNPNNSPRMSGEKDVARNQGMSYKRNSLSGQSKRDSRSEKRS
jgi:hypothetical protein